MKMSELQHLPNRNTSSLNQIKLTTNLYQIRLDKLKATFFYYHFQNQPSVKTQDCLRIFRESKDRELLCKKIGYICEYKNGVLGSKKVDSPIEVFDKSAPKAVVGLKVGETLDLQRLMSESCRQSVLKSLINPLVYKSIQNSEKSSRQDFIGTNRIVLTPTFHFTLVQLKKKFYLSTNVCMQIKEHSSVLLYFERYDKQSIKTLLIGRQVVTNYGVRSVYTVIDVDFARTAQSKNVFNGKQSTYLQFYKQKYSITINNTKQPLLVVRRKASKNPIYLIPELVSLHNAINPNQLIEKMKEKLQKKKWQLPQQKELYAVRVVRQLGESQVIKKSAHNFDGLQLKPPVINIDNHSIIPQDGLCNFRGRILKPVEIKNWGVVYLQGKDKQADANDISRLLYNLKAVGPQYGIKISNEPGLIPVPSSDLTEWNKAVSKDIERYGSPQFLIYFLRDQQSSFYAGLKKSIMQHKFPSQVIRRKTMDGSNKKPFAIAADILFQIQAKIGAVLWQINSNTDFSKKKLMFGAIHLRKTKQGLTFSLLGGMNPQGSQNYSYCKKGVEYSQINFQMAMMYWAKNYVGNSKYAPDTIIIYREELKDYSDRNTIEKELEQIKTTIRKVGEKTKTPNYNPSITYILVSQNHGVEIYSRAENQHKDFILQNPHTGTVVINKEQDDDTYSFYLNACRSFDRTDKPTKFTVFSTSQINNENLIGFTYDQCFNYFNFKGAIKIPGCLQYARKLSSFGESTEVQLGYEQKMNRMLYFL